MAVQIPFKPEIFRLYFCHCFSNIYNCGDLLNRQILSSIFIFAGQLSPTSIRKEIIFSYYCAFLKNKCNHQLNWHPFFLGVGGGGGGGGSHDSRIKDDLELFWGSRGLR